MEHPTEHPMSLFYDYEKFYIKDFTPYFYSQGNSYKDKLKHGLSFEYYCWINQPEYLFLNSTPNEERTNEPITNNTSSQTQQSTNKFLQHEIENTQQKIPNFILKNKCLKNTYQKNKRAKNIYQKNKYTKNIHQKNKCAKNFKKNKIRQDGNDFKNFIINENMYLNKSDIFNDKLLNVYAYLFLRNVGDAMDYDSDYDESNHDGDYAYQFEQDNYDDQYEDMWYGWDRS
jgi:hypothetical protein